ncbi:MAG: HAMP domain-containing sensor histidine kinase, partial [Candidatus Gastranaerophilales bacterium]|nr:HAMP domain-containing sensor histidine kinase [Candidatus Gastranaerophilales bacterium]
ILSKKFGTSLESFSEFLQDIYRTNEELLRIVNNILSVYHYESGKFELKIESANVNDMINDSVHHMKSLAKDQESEIITNIQENIPAVMVDKSEIIRVITNLISNAIKHNKKGTSIKVEVKRINGKVQVSVSDNGEGIPEEERSKIFRRYPTEKRKIGTGLGLYLSKQIIDAHKGTIWFETKEGKGTTFCFNLSIS